MKSVLISLSLILGSVSFSSASYGIQPAHVDPSHPNQCYVKETNSFYNDGDSWGIKGCGLATCVKIVNSLKNSQMMISYESCGTVGHDSECYLKSDESAEYPDCCPEVVCPDSSEDSSLSQGPVEDSNSQVYELPSPIKIALSRWNNTRQSKPDAPMLKGFSAEELSDQQGDLQNLDSQRDEESYDTNDYFLNSRKPSPRFFYWY